jgi:palmitoyltransferase ZDHHC9/14/18
LLAGTKRKISAVFGGVGANDDSMSPKKRKLTAMQTAAITKAQNAVAAEKAAREKAEKDAAELDAQRDSRENRAMKRLVSEQMSAKAKKVMRKGTRVSMPITKTKSTKYATVSVRRKSMPAPTSSKPTAKVSRLTSLKEIVKRGTRLPKIRKVEPMSSSKKTRKPLARSATPEEVDSEKGEEESPNITPASLRSAAKKMMQSKLPFKPLNLSTASSSRAAEVLAIPDTDDEEDMDEDEEESDIGDNNDSDDSYDTSARKAFDIVHKRYNKSQAKKQRVSAKLSAKTSLHKTGAGIKKNFTRGHRGRFGSSKTKATKP